MKTPNRALVFAGTLLLTIFACAPFWAVLADDRRAPVPKFSGESTRGIFFDSISEAIRGQRPSLESLRASKQAAADSAAQGAADGGSEDDTGQWDGLVTPTSLEDEIKRLKLHYDEVVTQPGPFKSGGYQDARLDLMMMSSLFAVITEHGGDVRWKEDAAAARDLLGRTAFNCNAGTTQVFNEARARKDDLRDLMTGTGLRGRKARDGNDWASIADRGPLMEYADQLREQLRLATNSAEDVQAEPDDVRRPAELLAVLGEILTQEGMDEADDPDYVAYSKAMTQAAKGVTRGLELDDYEAVSRAVGEITLSCDNCHGEYR